MGEVPGAPWDNRRIRPLKEMSERWFRCGELSRKVSQAARARQTKQVASPPLAGLVIEA